MSLSKPRRGDNLARKAAPGPRRILTFLQTLNTGLVGVLTDLDCGGRLRHWGVSGYSRAVLVISLGREDDECPKTKGVKGAAEVVETRTMNNKEDRLHVSRDEFSEYSHAMRATPAAEGPCTTACMGDLQGADGSVGSTYRRDATLPADSRHFVRV